MASAEVTTVQSQSKRPSDAVLAGTLAVMLILWSFNYLAAKVSLRYFDPETLVPLRMVCSAILIAPIYFAQRVRVPVRRQDFGTFFFLGIFGVLFNQGLFTIGINYTTSQHAVIIIAFGPVLVLLLAIALKIEFFTVPRMLGMLISIVGILVLEADHGGGPHLPYLKGDLIGLCGVMSYAIYAVFGKRVVHDYGAITMNTFNVLSAAILMLPFAIWKGAQVHWASIGWQGWAGMLYMAGASTVAAYTLFYWILRYMEASRVAAVNYFQPLMVVLIGIVFLHEEPTRNMLAAGVLVILGVYLAERGKSERLEAAEK